MSRAGASMISAGRRASRAPAARRPPAPTAPSPPRPGPPLAPPPSVGGIVRPLSSKPATPPPTEGNEVGASSDAERERAPTEEGGGRRSLGGVRSAVLSAALGHVRERGWTEDAIAAGVMSAGAPPSAIGLVSGGPVELVAFFMDRCNDDLRRALLGERSVVWKAEGTPVPDRIERSLRVRLEMVAPYAEGGRWHEAMALGASSPSAASRTASQLDAMASIVAEAAGIDGASGASVGAAGRRAALAAAYAATELHMLADESEGFADTWAFLRRRVKDLETAAEVAAGGPVGLLNGDVAVAAAAVATSLGGAAVSLARPAATGAVSVMASTVVPHIMTFMQPKQPDVAFSGAGVRQDGTNPSDYE